MVYQSSPFDVSPFMYSMCHNFGYMSVAAMLVCRHFDKLYHYDVTKAKCAYIISARTFAYFLLKVMF